MYSNTVTIIRRIVSRMKTLYVHVGQPKTGTTALQVFCLKNRKVLNKKGYEYPFFEYKYKHINRRRNGHFLVGIVRDEDGNRLKEEEARLMKEGLALVEDAFRKYDHVVLSDERLWHASKGPLFAYWNVLKEHSEKHGYVVKMIVYLRRQDVFATSWRNQMIKNGFEGAYGQYRWKEWLEKDTPGIVLDYYWLLEKIAAVIGKQNVKVRIYDRAWLERDGGNIYTDFLDAIDLKWDDSFVIEPEDPNPSLTLNLQEIKRIVNNTPEYEGDDGDLFGKAIRRCAAGKNPDYPCSMFSVEELKAFLAKYEESNNKIAREYLHREGPLFDMTIKELDKWTENNPYMYEDIIRYFTQVALLQQERIDKLQQVDIRKLKEGVAANKARLNKITDMAKHPMKAAKHIIRKK